MKRLVPNLTLLPLCLLFASIHAEANASPPNVVIILADDMGYGDLKSYNPDSKIPTPALDRLAAEGIRFTDAHTTGSTCIPARFGLMTGTYPFHQKGGMRDTVPLIPEDMPTLASLLKSGGYRTAMVGKWHLGFDDKPNPVAGKALTGGPMDRGFDSFFGIHASTDIPPYYYIDGRLPTGMPMKQIGDGKDDEATTGWNNIQGAFWRAGGIGRDLSLPEVTPMFGTKAVAFIARQSEQNDKADNASQPFFLYLALPSPHTPWLPTAEFVGKSGAGSYGDFMMTVDHEVGRVLKQLDDSGLADNTLVLFTSDNGPVWYAKDEKKYGHASVGKLRGMKGDNWEGGHRMPFIIRYPGKAVAGSSSDALVSFLDVSATLAELAGVTESIPADSISFLPSILGKENPNARTELAHGKSKRFMLRSTRWKLLLHKGSAGFSNRYDKGKPASEPPGQLYDMNNDLGETTNLWNDKPELVEKLSARLKEIIE